MSTLAFPGHRARPDGVRPRLSSPRKARSKEPRSRRHSPGRWPSWTEEVRICEPSDGSLPIDDAYFWADSEARYTIARPRKGG